jgi:multiple sugar transport system substrate-binding protein
MKIRKRLLTLAATVSIGMLAACGNSNSEGSQDQIQLEVMTWDSVQQDGVQKAIDAFEEKNPNINVNLETIPNKGDMLIKLNASIESGKAPDVFWQSYEASTYVEAGALEPLDEYISKDKIDLANYNSKIVDLYNMNDQQYGIPKDMDAWFIIYNTKLFDELGVEYPSENWTWEEMVETAHQLKEKMGDGQYPLWFNTGVRNGYGTLVEQLGGHIVAENNGELTTDFNNKAGQEAFKKLYELTEEGLMPNPVNNPDFDSLSSLVSNNVAMAAIPSWHIPVVSGSDVEKGTFAAVQFPSNNGSTVTDTNGLAYVMNSDSENKEAAWELIKFLTSDEGATIQAENGAGIPANNGAKQAWIDVNSNIANIEVVNTIAENNFLRVSSQFPEMAQAVDNFSTEVLPFVFTGEVSPEEATQQFEDMLQELMKK